MNYWIDIEDASGNKVGDGPIITASNISITDRIDKAGVFSFSMPAADPRAAFLKHKRIVRFIYRKDETTWEAGSGIVEKIVPTSASDGETMLQVSGDNMMRELANRSVGFLQLSDSAGNGVTNSISQVMSYAPAGWVIDGSVGTQEPAGNVYGAFAGESVLNALNTIAKQKGEHFRKQSGRKIAWLGKTITPSGVRAVHGGDPVSLESNRDACIITGLEETQDAYNIITRIYPYGSGVGEARLTLMACTRAVPVGFTLDKANNCIINNTAETIYGRSDKYLSFKDAAPISSTDIDMESAANVLFDAAMEHLKKHATIEKFYRISISKLARPLQVGNSIRVIYRRIIDGFITVDINADLFILETTTEISNTGMVTNSIDVSTIDRYRETEDALLAAQLAEGRTFESHPQLNANAYVVSYREPMDNSKSGRFDFWLGAEVVNVVQVAFRFRIDPLRSTVKSVTGSSSTSSSGGGGTSTSSSGGGQTATSTSIQGLHYHNVYVDGNAGSFATGQSAVVHAHNVSIGGHSHNVDIPSHNHTVTPNVSLVYGLFENSSGSLVEANLVYSVNSGAAIGRATDIGGGWYEIDLTSRVANGLNSRPNRRDNYITISTAVAKNATITGQLVVRTTIQAIAIL